MFYSKLMEGRAGSGAFYKQGRLSKWLAGSWVSRLIAYRRILLTLLVPLSLLLIQAAKAFPRWTERVYSSGIYPALRACFARLFSLAPVSVSELLLIAGCAALPVGLVWWIRRLVTDAGHRGDFLLRTLSTLGAAAGIVYFLFVLTCGFNYYRLEFTEHSGLLVRDSSSQELSALYGELVASANELRGQVTEDASGVMVLSGSFSDNSADAVAAYGELSTAYPALGGYTPQPKAVLLSRGMSWLHITGIYIPFTFEANVNVDTPSYSIPSAMLHELAHSKGFMREDEANFISYLACTASSNPDLAYSGTMLAMIHTANALYSADRDAYFEIALTLDEGVRRDLEANSAYWRQFEGPAAQVSTAVNNTYLRSNNQPNGVKSYGRMVDLLLAEYRQKHNLQ